MWTTEPNPGLSTSEIQSAEPLAIDLPRNPVYVHPWPCPVQAKEGTQGLSSEGWGPEAAEDPRTLSMGSKSGKDAECSASCPTDEAVAAGLLNSN